MRSHVQAGPRRMVWWRLPERFCCWQYAFPHTAFENDLCGSSANDWRKDIDAFQQTDLILGCFEAEKITKVTCPGRFQSARRLRLKYSIS
jgi:hypothetical protein